MKSASIATATFRTHRLHSLMAPGNLSNPANPANPSSLQITSQLVARGAGGRGEALRSALTPQGYRACQGGFSPFPRFLSDPSGFEGSGRSAPAAGPSQN